MPYPFGGHPSFSNYIEWATSQGCEVKQAISDEKWLVKIVRPDKKRSLIEVDVPLNSLLVPTQVWYYDRVLGLKSPWTAIDPGGSH